jgi:hypothetical protein
MTRRRRRGRAGPSRGLAPVDRGDLAGLGVEVHEVAAAADAGAVGLGDAEGGGGGHGRVDGVPALAQHFEARGARLGVDG